MRKDREGLTMKDLMMERSIQLFAQKGFKETSIQDIVNELNVTKGTFYYYLKRNRSRAVPFRFAFRYRDARHIRNDKLELFLVSAGWRKIRSRSCGYFL